MSADSVAWHI